ncbi:MAG: sortase [bacterium]|nr:sortase [bacterium]
MRAASPIFAASALLIAILACSRADAPITAGPLSVTDELSASPITPTEPTALPTETPITTQLPTSMPTPEPAPVAFTGDQIQAGLVVLRIPEIRVQASLERAEELMGSNGPAFTKPDANPLWVPGWGAEIGREGVALIYGHRQWGPVPKVFTALDQLENGDLISVTSGGETLIFAVTDVVVIYPDEFWETFFRYDDQALQEERVQIALVTCTPWGTDRQRLIVFAEMIQEEVRIGHTELE